MVVVLERTDTHGTEPHEYSLAIERSAAVFRRICTEEAPHTMWLVKDHLRFLTENNGMHTNSISRWVLSDNESIYTGPQGTRA